MWFGFGMVKTCRREEERKKRSGTLIEASWAKLKERQQLPLDFLPHS